jgi:hypothetical protein
LTGHKIKIVLTVYDVRVGRLLVDVRLYLFHEGRMTGVGGFKPSVRLQRGRLALGLPDLKGTAALP